MVWSAANHQAVVKRDLLPEPVVGRRVVTGDGGDQVPLCCGLPFVDEDCTGLGHRVHLTAQRPNGKHAVLNAESQPEGVARSAAMRESL